MKILCWKKGSHLIPMFDSDGEVLAESRLKDGEAYQVEIKQPRNVMHHRKYFALLNLCLENQEQFENIEDLRYYLTCKAGYYKIVETDKGAFIIPKSIKFSEMDQTEFNRFYYASVNAVANFLKTDNASIIKEISNFL